MDHYFFPAVLEKCEEGGYTVFFPDIKGCITEGDTLEEALKMATEALELYLYNLELSGSNIPMSTPPEKIKTVENESFVNIIIANMIRIRASMENKTIKKTLTIPKWLNDVAEKEHINFSQTLQVALKEKLCIKQT